MSDYNKVAELGGKLGAAQGYLKDLNEATSLRIRVNSDRCSPIVLKGASHWFNEVHSMIVASLKEDIEILRNQLKEEVAKE